MNEQKTNSDTDAWLTHGCSRTVRRQLLHLSSVYQGSSGYYREALRPVIRTWLDRLEARA